jgi:MinD-like ATPase involved in chromosome partitioning or flagellar assembly
MKPFWVSFYSYKGGVGRSLALANLAALLAHRGRRVLMIDFDLEAPGLDSFRELGVVPKTEGVVEYVHQFQKTRIAPRIEDYVQECRFPKPTRGKVWLMPSGKKDDAYNSKRAAIDWEKLYCEGLGEPFIANWKAAIQRVYRPDYVFVDSRTGLTDVGGVCTLHLPDAVVLLFALNDQNVHGIAAVLQAIRATPSPQPPQVIAVATPVPNLPRDEEGLLKTRLAEAEKVLGLKIENTISYNPQAALIEKIFTLESESRTNRTVMEYNFLLEEIQKRDLNGLDSLIRRAEQACERDDNPAADRIKNALEEDYGDRADAQFHIGQIVRRFGSREDAVLAWKKALGIDPSHNDAFQATLGFLKQRNQDEEIIRLYDARIEHLRIVAPNSVSSVVRDKAERLMVLQRFTEAVAGFREARERAGDDPDSALAALFNEAEAERRAEKQIHPQIWGSVIKLFEEDVSIENRSLALQANMLQALHIAYACNGKLKLAEHLLDRAKRCAVAVGKTEPIFCVKTYTFLPADEFLSVNEEMTASLRKTRLWDGMELPGKSQPA